MALKLPGKTVVVSCVVFETVKVTDPVRYIRDHCGKVHRVHLIHYDRSTDPDKRSLYGAFYEKVRSDLLEMGVDDILEVNDEVYLFDTMLSHLHEIIRLEKGGGNSVYVNISAGPPEYAAAAMLACMMSMDGPDDRRIVPFAVHARKWTVHGEDAIRRMYFDGDEPVGMTREVSEPEELHLFGMEPPDENLVRSLRALKDLQGRRGILNYRSAINELMERGLWSRPARGANEDIQSLKMYYKRNYLDRWKELGWIEMDGKAMLFTPSGEMVMNVFYLERDE